MKSVIDLFSGVGGLSLGAVHSGLDLVGSVELDEIASNTHQINFPESLHMRADISNLSGKDLLRAAKQSELYGLIGGPPCQGFSSIGKRNIMDPRNQLFIHFFRLVNETKPVFFMAENVKGILDNKFSDIVSEAFNYVKEDYNMLRPLELNAKDFGVPTARSRILFIGVRKDINKILDATLFQDINNNLVTVSEAFEGLGDNLFMGDSKNNNHIWTILNDIKEDSYAKSISQRSSHKVGNDQSKNRYFTKNEVTGMIVQIIVWKY